MKIFRLNALFFFGFYQRYRQHAWTPEPIFTRNMSDNAVPRKDVPFRG